MTHANPTLPLDSRISEDEIDELSDFLDSVKTAMTIERLDGFFSALVIGPDVVLPSEYWPIVMGSGPSGYEAFGSQQEYERIFGMAKKFWNTIAGTLSADKIYSPVFLTDDDGHLRGNEWATGFMQGVALRSDQWAEVFTDQVLSEAIVPMLALSQENESTDSRRFKLPPPPLRKDFLKAMTYGMRQLYEHFLQQRSGDMPQARSSVVRSSPKVGRNDLCPCGSGKKYKQCCAMRVH
ncbi:UPF0149 family protein [Povalibacter sp.]|uniref:UPF0149 family protein n=1 Tax=Povalibacter sp. TaxID=1962978 RepID=UPI002F3FBDD0